MYQMKKVKTVNKQASKFKGWEKLFLIAVLVLLPGSLKGNGSPK
jgi:hypothetical protein